MGKQDCLHIHHWVYAWVRYRQTVGTKETSWKKKTNHKNNTYYIFLGINTINNKVSSIYLYLYLGVVQLVHQISAAGPSVTIELAVTKL